MQTWINSFVFCHLSRTGTLLLPSVRLSALLCVRVLLCIKSDDSNHGKQQIMWYNWKVVELNQIKGNLGIGACCFRTCLSWGEPIKTFCPLQNTQFEAKSGESCPAEVTQCYSAEGIQNLLEASPPSPRAKTVNEMAWFHQAVLCHLIRGQTPFPSPALPVLMWQKGFSGEVKCFMQHKCFFCHIKGKVFLSVLALLHLREDKLASWVTMVNNTAAPLLNATLQIL